MKKLMIPIVLLLIVMLAISALGCRQIKGSGIFYDVYTGNPVEFKANIAAGKKDGGWTDAKGNIQLDDESRGITVRGRSEMSLWESSKEFVAWDIEVNGEKYDYLAILYDDSEESPYFMIVIVDEGEIEYEWLGWEDDIEGKIKIKE